MRNDNEENNRNNNLKLLTEKAVQQKFGQKCHNF